MKRFALVLFYVSFCCSNVNKDEFSLKLLHSTQMETRGHVLISPFGIWTLLTATTFGASGNSYSEIQKTLNLSGNLTNVIKDYNNLTGYVLAESDDFNLKNYNFVFMHITSTLFASFRRISQNDFGAYLKEFHFGDPDAAVMGNAYIREISGFTADLFIPRDFQEEPSMILTNVINCKGSLFKKADIVTEPFYNEDNKIINNVDMMFTKGQFAFSNIKALQSFVVELPFGTSGKFSMLVILPYPLVKISDVFKNFSQVSFKDIFQKLQNDTNAFGMEDVFIKLPRLSVTKNLILNKPLNDIGVQDIFQPDLGSFNTTADNRVFVSKLMQKIHLELSEFGTTAATESNSDTIPSPYFPMNRPFLYFIMEKTTTTVIFNGVYQ